MAADDQQAPKTPETAPETPETAPETVSPHQVAAMSRILGLNPDNVVSIHVELGRVDVVLYDPPAGAGHPLLRERRFMVEQ